MQHLQLNLNLCQICEGNEYLNSYGSIFFKDFQRKYFSLVIIIRKKCLQSFHVVEGIFCILGFSIILFLFITVMLNLETFVRCSVGKKKEKEKRNQLPTKPPK